MPKQVITNSTIKGIDEDATRMANAGMSKQEIAQALSDKHKRTIRVVHIRETD